MCSLIKATLEDAPDTPARAASLPSLKSCLLLCSPLLGPELQSPRRRTGPSASSSLPQRGPVASPVSSCRGEHSPGRKLHSICFAIIFPPEFGNSQSAPGTKPLWEGQQVSGTEVSRATGITMLPYFFWWLRTEFTKSGWLRRTQSH